MVLPACEAPAEWIIKEGSPPENVTPENSKLKGPEERARIARVFARGLTDPTGHFLHFLAFEVDRSPDGSWLVLGDRTQAPSGSGFALENRMATARVFPDLFPNANVRRLAGFFRAFRDAMNGLWGETDSRVAILTPGQHTDTYFEHAHMARCLGFPLLECEDLKAEQGRLKVRTIDGLQPGSMLWRRLDSRFADPLELDESSALGTPGMVAALRARELTMLNCFGSGVLEARAMMAFLPRICERLTGQPLKISNIVTWWCGQTAERGFVYDNLQRMMIGRALSTDLPFEVDALTALGGDFRGSAQKPIGDWLETDGANLVGQEAVTLSTTPAMIGTDLVPRPALIRVFLARTPEGWTVMPGGYARIGRTEDPTALSMKNGGSVADVWVVSDAPVIAESLSLRQDGPFVRRLPGVLPSRAADNLYWLGRYVERTGRGAGARTARLSPAARGGQPSRDAADRPSGTLSRRLRRRSGRAGAHGRSGTLRCRAGLRGQGARPVLDRWLARADRSGLYRARHVQPGAPGRRGRAADDRAVAQARGFCRVRA